MMIRAKIPVSLSDFHMLDEYYWISGRSLSGDQLYFIIHNMDGSEILIPGIRITTRTGRGGNIHCRKMDGHIHSSHRGKDRNGIDCFRDRFAARDEWFWR